MPNSKTARWPVAALVGGTMSMMASVTMAQDVDPAADEILRAMSDYLSSLQTFSVTADASSDILTRDGAKVQMTSTSEIVLDRDQGFRATRTGPAGSSTIVYDGERVTIANEALGVHLYVPAAGGLDTAIDEVRSTIGAEITGGSDLFYDNPYEGLMYEVRSGAYMGEVTVGGVNAHHLLYRAADIDWQLWVRSEGDPIPVRYVITSKWVTAAPAFSVQFWDFTPGVETAASDFDFVPPEGSTEVDPMTVNGRDIIGEG